MNNSVQRGQNEISKNNYSSHSDFGNKKLLTVCLSDVKKIIRNQCDLHFYECLAEYITSLNLRNVV